MLISICLTGCKKERFPDSDDVIGNWYSEKEPNYVVSFTATVFTSTRGNDISTANYKLDRKEKQIILDWNTSPPFRFSTKITFNNKNRTLTLYGLSMSTGSQSVEVFKKR